MTNAQPIQLWSVWVTNNGERGRWMSDWDNNKKVWAGTREDAERAAAARRPVWGPEGTEYEVRPTPEGAT